VTYRRHHIVFALAIASGCQAAAEEAVPARKHDELMGRFHMYRGYDLSRAIDRLLVRGDLDNARALAASMANITPPPALETWARQTSLVRDRAAALASATSVDDACRRAARVGEACAACHVDAGARLAFDAYPAAPADDPTIDARMARHRWAVDRLWEGMIGNADKPWQAGLGVLAVTPLPFSPAAGDRVALAAGLQRLVRQAKEQNLTTPSQRAQVYGEILVTCAACHSGRSSTPR
jgi:mono/diheme cytochrome c family protein